MFGIPNLKYKTTICHSWQQGLECNMGLGCFFAHGEHELRTMEQNKVTLMAQSPHSVEPTLSKFKTRYCKFYNKGACKLGDKCAFAHHKDQKRPVLYIPKQEYVPSYQPFHQYQPYPPPYHAYPPPYYTDPNYYYEAQVPPPQFGLSPQKEESPIMEEGAETQKTTLSPGSPCEEGSTEGQ